MTLSAKEALYRILKLPDPDKISQKFLANPWPSGLSNSFDGCHSSSDCPSVGVLRPLSFLANYGVLSPADPSDCSQGLSMELDGAVSNDSAQYALDKLVPVVWQLIARHLNGYDIMALLMTCSRGIVGRWRHSKISDFEILPTGNPRWTGAAFGSLQHLYRLQSIKLLASNLKVLEQGPQLLLYLPSQLLKLSLGIPCDLEDWLLIPPRLPLGDLISYDGRDFGRDETRLAMFKTAFASPTTPMLVDLNALFPDLEELELQAALVYRPRVSSQKTSVMKKQSEAPKNSHQAQTAALVHFYGHLPSTALKTLRMTHTWVTAEDREVFIKRGASAATSKPSRSSTFDTFSNLPQCLQTLETKLVYKERTSEPLELPTNVFDGLPRSLTSLSIDIVSDTTAPTTDQHKLFAPLGEMKSLTWLSLSLCDEFRLTQDLLSSLSHASSLSTLDTVTSSPRGLTFLRLELPSGSELPVGFIASLPRTLEQFELKLSSVTFPRGRNAKSIGSELPSSLKSFKMLHSTPFGDPLGPIFGIQDIPSGLVELDWSERCKISDEQVKALPSSLETLRLDFSYLTFKCHPTNCKCSHYMDPFEEDYNPYLPPRVATPDELVLERSLSDDAAFNLPRQLSTLVLRHTSFGSCFFTNLPPSLTHLEIDTDRPLEGDIFFSCALQYLFIDASSLSLHSLSSLPNTLRTLHLIEPISSPSFDKAKSTFPLRDLTLASDFIALLPPSITDLQITGARDVTDEAQWPPSLTNLVMTASSFLTELSLPRLPKTLTRLQVKRMVIAPHACKPRAEILKMAPPFLPVLSLPWMTLKNRVVDFSALP